jgi:two-component system LytT family response regulator
MLRAILIDDELNNLENLSALLAKYCPQVMVIGKASDAATARGLIAALNPDLVFLDVQMPHENGFTLLKSLPEITFDVIFVTAYDQYGVQAIKFSALDYLLKPVDIEELKRAVNKAEQQHNRKQQQSLLQNLLHYFNNEKSRQQKLALPTAGETRLVSITDIVRCESSNSYTTFFLSNGEKVMVSRPIGEYEQLLGGYDFIRVHQSHLVNKEYVQSLLKKDGFSLLLKDGSMIPVSRQKKETVMEVLKLG